MRFVSQALLAGAALLQPVSGLEVLTDVLEGAV